MNAASIALAFCLVSSSILAQEEAKLRVPEVLLSSQHEQMVAVGVGDRFPRIDLPGVDGSRRLAELLGSDATVVAVVQTGRPMSKALLRDLHFDVRKHYVNADDELRVSTVVLIKPQSGALAKEVDELLKAGELPDASKGNHTLLLGEESQVLDMLGTGRMPRVYVLNSEGQIEWLDIEYSLSTRREMKQTVRALVAATAAD